MSLPLGPMRHAGPLLPAARPRRSRHCLRANPHLLQARHHLGRARRTAPWNQRAGEGIWLISYMSYDLGFADLPQKTLQPLGNPFGPRLPPMS
jgi:hypothetical protein